MKLSLLLKLQVGYMILGLGYNCTSLILVYSGGKPLSNTSSTIGIVALLIYGLFLIFGYLSKYKMYRLLMLISFIGFGYGGVISHVLNFSNLDLYYSFLAWFLAIMINLMGASLNLIAFTGNFTANRNTGG